MISANFIVLIYKKKYIVQLYISLENLVSTGFWKDLYHSHLYPGYQFLILLFHLDNKYTVMLSLLCWEEIHTLLNHTDIIKIKKKIKLQLPCKGEINRK